MSLQNCLHNKPFEFSIENNRVKAFYALLEIVCKRHTFKVETRQGANQLFFTVTALNYNFALAYFDLNELFIEFTKTKK
ncbi:MAG: hypothetical protein H0U95_01130 [Bacteroidetes bacterium]|nr:hypothetical protein [Bacteroidota bacterium]